MYIVTGGNKNIPRSDDIANQIYSTEVLRPGDAQWRFAADLPGHGLLGSTTYGVSINRNFLALSK